MKKIFTLCVVALVALSMSAKPYTHSIGLVGGFGIGVQFKDMVTDHFTIIDEFGYFLCPFDQQNLTPCGGYQGAIDNLVLAYQADAVEGQGIDLDWYVGGQLKIGYGVGNFGIFGVGAAAGIEAKMQNAPIAVSFDFRPGYGCMFNQFGPGHIFDYTFNLGVRYAF